jgi:hypothetical protein
VGLSELGDCLAGPFSDQQQAPKLEMGGSKIRLVLNRHLVVPHGFVALALALQHRA